ncbi:Transposase [Corynebacterium faecale]|nr:Transposase [Corynebacterium faecale]
MPIKTYTEEFKRDAVALYENSDGASIQKIANDLGINRMTLKNWITKYGANSTPHGANTATVLSEASADPPTREGKCAPPRRA